MFVSATINLKHVKTYFYCFAHFLHFSNVISLGYSYDLHPREKKYEKVLPRNFFYSRRKLRKKLEALRKKQFSSSGVWDVLYLSLHPHRFCLWRHIFSNFWTFYYLTVVPWAHTFVTSKDRRRWNNCCFVNYFFFSN